MDNNYWVDFWKNYTTDVLEKDEQSQVLRTFDKKPITDELWGFTLNKIDEVFNVNEGDNVLDLCCGNGLLSKHYNNKGAKVTAVDVSSALLDNISKIDGITAINSDIRSLNFENNSFEKVILYAGIQYLNDKESIELIQNIYNWLKPNGCLFIGDVPDVKKRWDFYNTEERQAVYFNNQLEGKAIVGHWFEKDWFDKLTNFIGFNEGIYHAQDDKLIYSIFRFDYLYKKQ
jgi:cyclopropane fatty-acyl-phospholipid synthase-like methyltransferase